MWRRRTVVGADMDRDPDPLLYVLEYLPATLQATDEHVRKVMHDCIECIETHTSRDLESLIEEDSALVMDVVAALTAWQLTPISAPKDARVTLALRLLEPMKSTAKRH